MKIIAFEGLDKSGKHTQSNLLADYLKNKGYRVVQSEFHRYDTPTGQLIQKWLYRQWNVDDLTIEYVMAADKQAQQQWFTELEKQGVDILILDRYTSSQRCFAQAKGMDPKWVQALQQHMRSVDVEIMIDITPEESYRRKGKHGENDRYESDIAFLSDVRQQYLEHRKTMEHYCFIEQADTLSVETLAETIRNYMQTYLEANQ